MIKFRKATRIDIPVILELIKRLATYEEMLNEVTANIVDLEIELFDQKNAFVILAYEEAEPIGFALYFFNFSTFKGKKGLYLEDLYIKPKYRNKGIGNQFFEHLIEIAKSENCGRIEWVCLNWNKPAIDFYLKKNAIPLKDWTIYRIDENQF